MNDFGSVIETEEVAISKSGVSTIANSESVVLPDSNLEDSLDEESFGEIILDCEIMTHRKKKPVRMTVGFTNHDLYDIRQRRHDSGRAHGEEYEFDLDKRQRETLDRWNEIYEEEVAEEKAATDRRMKRNQQIHGRIG
tara:strand:+ start:268 stop:681 length:414 start_codon:yes stop_codon:yes gene_type:complete